MSSDHTHISIRTYVRRISRVQTGILAGTPDTPLYIEAALSPINLMDTRVSSSPYTVRQYLAYLLYVHTVRTCTVLPSTHSRSPQSHPLNTVEAIVIWRMLLDRKSVV